MSNFWLDNSFLLLLGAGGVWFVLRFVLGPRRGAPRLSTFFKREATPSVDGLGQKSIATLLADTRAFVAAEEGLRGLLLAGPFAVAQARSSSPVTLIALAEAPETYGDAEWLLRWAYPARGHKVLEHQERSEPGLVSHRLALRGAPPIDLHFVRTDQAAPPEALDAALATGTLVLEDPAGQAERLRRQWESLRRSASAPNTKNNKETTP